MRFVAPTRDELDPRVLSRPPLSDWAEFDEFLSGTEWPRIEQLNARRGSGSPRFVAQTRELEAEALHYELRIAHRGEISTRECNWHDLLNALVWLRFPDLKRALNARQVEEIGVAGPRERTRAQCALTHFDEAGVIVVLRDPRLLALWDAHDWPGLFWRERDAWRDNSARVIVFGHALLEHALRPAQLLVGKAIAVTDHNDHCSDATILARVAREVRAGTLLSDPQELRPLPLAGIPGWSAQADEKFLHTAPCFRPLRAGRVYPAPAVLA